MKKAIAILLIAVLALTCFVACGKKDKGGDAAGPEGKYVAKVSEDELKEAGVESAEELYCIELKAEGKATMTAQGLSQDGTWTQEGDKLTITFEDESSEATLNGSELTIGTGEDAMVLVKQ